jgi:Flp pilus assembly protein TadG
MRAPRIARQRGFALYMTAIFMMMIIPMIGLSIDATLLYVVKTRLQGAVDGAALAGAKALSHGTDSPSEKIAAIAAAKTYVKLNFPSSYFFSQDVLVDSNNGVAIDESVAFQRTVTVTASVLEPTLFMKWLNFASTNVTATAGTVRKDVNIAMVMDRSGSLTLSGSCAPLIAAAQNFVGIFSPGNDNVGLITFASSTYVNFPPSTTFASASPDVVAMLGNIVCQGSTSTAYALWTGYQQLIALNQPGALNAILLFTDGDPTGVYVNMPIANSSPCSAYTHGSPGGAGGYALPGGAKGYIPGLYNIFTQTPFGYFGLINPVDPNPPVGGEQVVTTQDEYTNPNSTGCTYNAGGAPVTGNNCIVTDFTGLPLKDVNGNSLSTSYNSVTLNATGMISLGTGGPTCVVASPDGMNPFLNAADDAAKNIRNGATDPTSGKSLNGIIIFTIGLGNAAVPVNPTFLERVANDPRSPIYDNTKATGSYTYAATSSDLQSAFAAVASEILRLAR